MRIKVQYVSRLRVRLDKKEEDVEAEDGTTLLKLLHHLSDAYGEQFREELFKPTMDDLKENWVVMVNGVLHRQLQGLETKLKNGDTVSIIPFMSGG